MSMTLFKAMKTKNFSVSWRSITKTMGLTSGRTSSSFSVGSMDSIPFLTFNSFTTQPIIRVLHPLMEAIASIKSLI